jgi:anti-anti-sigma regulatory factor
VQGLAGTASAAAAVASRGRDIIVDLADLEFTGCGGPGTLRRALRQARHGGGGLVLTPSPGDHLRVRRRLGLRLAGSPGGRPRRHSLGG